MKVIHGECSRIMKSMPDNSIDFIVTDPPYGLNFMNKQWDKSIPNEEIWIEALRVCKPGSMLAAFGGSRTHHHLMIALEKSGWEIRDVIMWLYGSGFPKSHNHFGLEGYGTALKPAYEPIIICMKPLDGTYKHNVETWGLGGINIDESRISMNEEDFKNYKEKKESFNGLKGEILPGFVTSPFTNRIETKGRWPANIILDEEAAIALDEMTGNLKSGKLTPYIRNGKNPYSGGFGDPNGYFEKNEGGASRFFYCAKASPSERKGNNHPTVKPIALMKYIIKLLAPPGNPVCLDPFSGSGSTLLAAKELGIDCIGIEMQEEYCEIAINRLGRHDQ